MNRRHRTLVYTLSATAAAAFVLIRFWSYAAPFLAASLLAAMIDPYVHRLRQATGLRRGAAVLVVLTVFLALLAGGLALVAANLIVELERLLLHLPEYAEAAAELADRAAARAGGLLARLPPPLDEMVLFDSGQAAEAAAAAVRGALGRLRAAPGAVFFFFVTGLATFFISRDRHLLWNAVLRALPAAWRRPLVVIRDEIAGGALALVRAQLILLAVTAAAGVAGLSAAGVPYAWALGLAAGVLDLAPAVGPGAVFGPVAVAYALAGRPGVALGVCALWLALVLVRQLLEPHVLGAHTGLHPVTVLAAVYVGVKAAGAAGFFIGPLALVVVRALLAATLPAGGTGPKADGPRPA